MPSWGPVPSRVANTARRMWTRDHMHSRIQIGSCARRGEICAEEHLAENYGVSSGQHSRVAPPQSERTHQEAPLRRTCASSLCQECWAAPRILSDSEQPICTKLRVDRPCGRRGDGRREQTGVLIGLDSYNLVGIPLLHSHSNSYHTTAPPRLFNEAALPLTHGKENLNPVQVLGFPIPPSPRRSGFNAQHPLFPAP